MDLLCFELKLAWRRLGRRKAHTALILATFTLSIALALLSWSLFNAVFLRHPDFDPNGSLHVILQTTPNGGRERAFLPEVEAWASSQQVFAEFGPIKQPRPMLVATPEGNERLSATFLSTQALTMLRARPVHRTLVACAPVAEPIREEPAAIHVPQELETAKDPVARRVRPARKNERSVQTTSSKLREQTERCAHDPDPLCGVDEKGTR